MLGTHRRILSKNTNDIFGLVKCIASNKIRTRNGFMGEGIIKC